MRLATRFFLAAGAVSVLPVAATGLLVSRALNDRFEADFEQDVAALAGRVEGEYGRIAEVVRAALGRLEGSRLIEQARLLAAGSGGADVLEEAPRSMAALGLDVLTVCQRGGAVVAAGHLPGLAGSPCSVPDPPWGPQLRTARLRGEDGLDELLTLQVAVALERFGVHWTLVGGRRIDAAFLQRLLPAPNASLVLTDAAGRRLARAGGRPKGPSQTISLARRSDGAEAARLTLTVSRGPLDHTLALLLRTALLAGGGAVVLALLASLLLARRLARPLQGLARGVRSVAAGDLDATLPDAGPAEIREVVTAFNRMTADLTESRLRLRHSERVAAWRDVARRIAHEVKNPLSPIRMAMETLRKAWQVRPEGFSDLLDESTETVLEEVERLNRMVTGFSRFAKMPAPQPERLDLGEAVRGALALHAAGLPESVHLETGLADGVVVRADRDQLVQVVSNLVKNAGEALVTRGGTVRVTVDRDDRGRPRLAVTDDGPGLPTTVRDDPFAPYVTTKPDGTGLGLAEVQRVASDHGGEARHAVPAAGGCRFEVVLPSAREQSGPP